MQKPILLCHSRESGNLRVKNKKNKMDSRFHGNDIMESGDDIKRQEMTLKIY